jgi:hypothetical protein
LSVPFFIVGRDGHRREEGFSLFLSLGKGTKGFTVTLIWHVKNDKAH